MKLWRWGAALMALLFVFLLVSAPARLLVYFLPSKQIVAQGFGGSLWNGTADSVAIAAPGGHLQLGRVEWELSPWSLLLFSPAMDLETTWGKQRLVGNLRLYPGGDIELSDTDISLDASLVKSWLPIQIDGQLSVLTPELAIEDAQLASGQGRLVWQRARWYSSRGPQPLGDYVAEFEIPDSGQLSAKISTLSGPVEINGQASLFGQALTVDLKLTSKEAFHPELAQTLGLMAEPVDGGFNLKMSMDL